MAIIVKPGRRQDGRGYKQKFLGNGFSQVQLEFVASEAKYAPSPYHCRDAKGKIVGRGKPASHCPPYWTDGHAIAVVRRAIREGLVSRVWLDVHPFPRHIWYSDAGMWYEGRTDNSTPGVYHGYPIEEIELPDGLPK
jgi:hypothetical protein